MKDMTAATLILIAPCSLLLGAALQIFVARLCSARTKGILAFLACVPAIIAVLALVPGALGLTAETWSVSLDAQSSLQ